MFRALLEASGVQRLLQWLSRYTSAQGAPVTDGGAE